jgi:hypothetical protein
MPFGIKGVASTGSEHRRTGVDCADTGWLSGDRRKHSISKASMSWELMAEPPTLRAFLRRGPRLSAWLGFIIFWWWSLTPSLLPRPWLAQGIVSALSGASG